MTITVLRGANVPRLRPAWHRGRAALKDAGAPLRGGLRPSLTAPRPRCPRACRSGRRDDPLDRTKGLLEAVDDASRGCMFPACLTVHITLDVIFGIFWLLGYQFSPRIADVGGARFWRTDPAADYGPLDKLAAHKVRTGLIAEHWDDLLRLAGSLKLGLVQAGGLMRTLQTNDRPTRLARALEELGRIIKTLYLLAYIDDEAYRRRILTQLNRGEGRHQLARVVFHGKRGELRQRYREGQEDQLGALGLVVNAIILWNTIYMDAALDQLRMEGFDVRNEDVARLSPLAHEHINMLGRYAFTLPEPVARGELRPLRSPVALAYEDA